MDYDTLYAQLEPLIRRLIQEWGVDPGRSEALGELLYERFCELMRAYDPSRGVPLRPYLTRNLSAVAAEFGGSQGEASSGGVSNAAAMRSQIREAIDRLDARIGAPRPPVLPALIAQLPREQQQILIWRYYEVRSYEEIAETLGVSPSRVRLLLRRALQRLRKKIAAIRSGALNG